MSIPLEPSFLQGMAAENRFITPYSLRRMFLLLTRVHYSDSAHYGDMMPPDRLGKFIYSKDPKLCTLPVLFDYNYSPKNSDAKPAIYVGTDDFEFLPKVVNNQQGANEDRSGMVYGKEEATHIIVRHTSGSPDETLMLGDLTSQFFLGIREKLQEELNFRSFDVQRLVTAKPFLRGPEEADTQFIVDLVMEVRFNAAWLTLRESHRIKTIGFRQAKDEFD